MFDFEPAQRLGVTPDRKLEQLSVTTRSTLTPKPRKKRRALNRNRKQDVRFSSGGSPRGARGRRSPDAQFPADPADVALTGAIAIRWPIRLNWLSFLMSMWRIFPGPPVMYGIDRLERRQQVEANAPENAADCSGRYRLSTSRRSDAFSGMSIRSSANP
jgi:hypothetical protein